MRKRFEQQMNLRTVAISNARFPVKSRDELPPVLKALQYIFITPELNEKVFQLLEEKICKGKKKTGRKGMDLWHVLVLAVVRHTLDTNWDRLLDTANYHELVRSIMGVHATAFIEHEKIEFNYQNILDNVTLLDDQLLEQVNQIVVQAGYQLLKKKEREEAFKLKSDSYVLETNVHFPTDLNLLYDSVRKCLDVIKELTQISDIKGWRKIKRLYRSTKSLFRNASQQVFRSNGKNEQQKRQAVKDYLQLAISLQQRFDEVIETPPAGFNVELILVYTLALKTYRDYVKKFADQIERRLLKGQTIGANEKIYSIFEEHTEWITKGKQNKKVELGHLLLITTDQHHFIVDYKVMEKQKDASQIESLQHRIQKKFADKTIYSHSFDKGFWSKDNWQLLHQSGIEQVILPKRGRLNKAEQQREGSREFKKLRRAHSAVESNINMLEHHGLNRCMDKGLHGYKRSVGLSVLAYNLHQIGNALIANERNLIGQVQATLAKAA
jgi:transposase, IS5 family